MEKFKILDSIPLYEVSNYGNIRRLGTSNNLKPSTAKKNGYLGLSLYCKGKQYKKYVHRLVAEVFLGDIKDMTINHKDGNKLNNNVSNLEIVTSSDNNKHAYKIGLRTFTDKQRNALLQSRQKPVIDTQTGIYYDSLAEACRVTNDNYSAIRKRIMRKSSNVRFIYV